MSLIGRMCVPIQTDRVENHVFRGSHISVHRRLSAASNVFRFLKDGLFPWEQLGEVVHHYVGTVTLELVIVALAGNPDYQPELAVAAGLDAGDGVLDDNGARRCNAQLSCRSEKSVGCRLAVQFLIVNGVAINANFEKVREPGGLEHHIAVLARGDDSRLETFVVKPMHPLHRALVDLDAVAGNGVVDQLVLAVAEAAHGFMQRRIVGRALGQVDRSRLQEIPNAIEARLAVHMELVVGGDVERPERLTGPGRALAQVLVEHALPGPRVDARCVGDDPVEIEKHGVVLVTRDGYDLSLLGRSSVASVAAEHAVF